MNNEVVHTKTKHKVLTDAVYQSPVDQQELRTRKVIGFVLVALVLLIAFVCIT
ncbi:MAG: hypothetical protein WC856_06995 [Methylococcaceae bacterium]|jgi:hypothetical protein